MEVAEGRGEAGEDLGLTAGGAALVEGAGAGLGFKVGGRIGHKEGEAGVFVFPGVDEGGALGEGEGEVVGLA